MSDIQEKKALQGQLRRVFPRDLMNGRLTDSDFETIAVELPCYQNQDIPELLGPLLDHLVQTEGRDSSVSDMVIYFLDPHGSNEAETHKLNTTVRRFREVVDPEHRDPVYDLLIGTGSRSPSEVAQRIQAFAAISDEQAKAIVEWLYLARSWRAFRGCIADIDRAIAYWSSRRNKASN
jgi:hypothetical protein